MKNALLAVAVCLAPVIASAADKYVVRNGRAVVGGGARSSGGGGHAPAGVFQAGTRAAGGGAGGGPVYGSGGNPAFVGGARRGSSGHRSFHGNAQRINTRAYRVPQRAIDGSGSGEGGGAQTEAPPEAPGYFKYGAFIRTEGQKPQFAQASSPEREHTIAAGEIRLDPRRASDVGRSPGVRQGPRDTPPPCTPGSNGCGGSGGNAITPNAPASVINHTTHNGAHDNQNGNGNGQGNGFGGGTGFDPSF